MYVADIIMETDVMYCVDHVMINLDILLVAQMEQEYVIMDGKDFFVTNHTVAKNVLKMRDDVIDLFSADVNWVGKERTVKNADRIPDVSEGSVTNHTNVFVKTVGMDVCVT